MAQGVRRRNGKYADDSWFCRWPGIARGIGRIFAGAGLSLALALPFVSEAADSRTICPRPASIPYPPQILFRAYEPTTVLDHRVDLSGLPRVEGHLEVPPPGWVLQGVTLTNNELRIRHKGAKQTLPDGRLCVWVTWIEITLGIPEQHVYVASDYPEGSCEFRTVFAHEMKHVAINRRVTQAYAETMRKALLDGLDKYNPILFSNSNVPDDRITSAIQSLVRPVWTDLNAALKKENGVIDTPEAYRREHAESGCKDWFPKGMPSYAQPRRRS